MNLITLTNPRSPVSEAYRTLRTNLSFYSLDNPLRSLVMTTPAADNEKSAAVANLAVTLAQGGRRTVLVDCDLRRPSLHTFFGLNNDVGLTSMILNEEKTAPLQATSVDNLWLLASGPKPPNPADLLGSKKIDQLIEMLSESYDFVLFDAPPVVAVTDAAVLGGKVDGVLLVVNAGRTRRDHAERAKEMLEQAKVRLIGVTLINAPVDSAVGGYYE